MSVFTIITIVQLSKQPEITKKVLKITNLPEPLKQIFIFQKLPLLKPNKIFGQNFFPDHIIDLGSINEIIEQTSEEFYEN